MPITNFTTEIKARLLRFLADGMDADDVADEIGCLREHVIAIARNHGYPDTEKLGRAAAILERNLAERPTELPAKAAVAMDPASAPTGNTAHPTNVGDLIRHAKGHPARRIQAAADHIIDRVERLRELLAEDDEKNAEKRRQAAQRDAARAEVQRLEQELADAKAKLRPTPPAPS